MYNVLVVKKLKKNIFKRNINVYKKKKNLLDYMIFLIYNIKYYVLV